MQHLRKQICNVTVVVGVVCCCYFPQQNTNFSFLKPIKLDYFINTDSCGGNKCDGNPDGIGSTRKYENRRQVTHTRARKKNQQSNNPIGQEIKWTTI